MSAGRLGRLRDAVVQWRNWSLPTKLAAVMLVPVIFAITLGVGQIRWQIDQADEFDRVGKVLDTMHGSEPLLFGLQDERNRSVEYLVGDTDVSAFDGGTGELDRSIAEFGSLLDSSVNSGVVADRQAELRQPLDTLGQLRDRVRARQIPPEQAIAEYSSRVTAVLSLERALASSVADRSLSSTATAMHDMLGLQEEVRLQQAWVLTGLSEGSLRPAALEALMGSRARLANKIVDARSTISERWQRRLDETLVTPPIVNRNMLLGAVVRESTDNRYTGGFSVQRDMWNAASNASVGTIDQGYQDLSAEVRAIAGELENDSSDSAGWDSVLLLAALIIAVAVTMVIGRQLLVSLRGLRSSALDVAEYELPEAVASIRQGNTSEAVVEPFPVDTTDEVGQLARAFDQVNQQALLLAVEQADLRRGYSDVFVGVSRRSQSLLERQLRLFEQLEQDEEDPDQLSRLFQLDHLATRMRRNNENLMVLAGSDLARRFTRPTDLADVLRAAVSEIEQYPRVVVQPPPNVKLRGHTASDLVRLVAELLDNAANFSAPDTTVTVSSYQAGDGTVVLDVLDNGIGMGHEELAQANSRLAQVDENDLATSRRMGLFVAGRLAVRHGVGVELHGGPDVEGVRATVMIPAEHVVSSESGPQQPASIQAQPGGYRNGHSHAELPTSVQLPQREERPEPEESPWQEPTPTPTPTPASLFEPASRPADRDESPTEHLFDALDIPQQPRAVSSADFGWPDVEPPAAPPAVAEDEFEDDEPQGGNDLGTGWFQPAAANPNLRARAEAEFGWPGEENDPEPEQGLTAEHDFGSGQDFGAAPGFPAEERPEEPPVTTSGLPRRKPREPQAVEPPTDVPARSAEDISRKLAHNGVQFGHSSGDTGEQPEVSAPGSWLEEPAGQDSWAAEPSTDEPPQSWVPAEPPEGEAWSFASDKAREAAEAAANPQPETFTEAGLPRRTPKAHLVPGSVAATEQRQSTGNFQRNPDQLRGRLADFQSGISRGRHRATDED